MHSNNQSSQQSNAPIYNPWISRGEGGGLTGTGRGRIGRGDRGRGLNNRGGGGGGRRRSSSSGKGRQFVNSTTADIVSPTTGLVSASQRFIPKSHQTNTKNDMPICTFYLAGRCNFGFQCRFYHPDVNNVNKNQSGGSGGALTYKQQQQLLQSQQQQQQQANNSMVNNNVNNNNSNQNNAISYISKGPREFDAFKAEAINIAKLAQDMEGNKFATLKEEGPFYSMDIECVAIGYGHTDKQRYPCRVSLVKSNINNKSNHINNDDDDCNNRERKNDDNDSVQILVDEIVNLANVNVVSYMTPLTGMTAKQCLDSTKTKELSEIRELVKSYLSSEAILVGHSINHDVDWLGLVPGVDFKQTVDTSCIFRQRIPRNLGSAANVLRGGQFLESEGDPNNKTHPNYYNAKQLEIQKSSSTENKNNHDDTPDDTDLPFPTRYRIFSLRHCCIHLLDIDIQEKAHNPIVDAKYSLLLFQKYQSASPQLLRAVRDTLHRAPPTLSFAAENPLIDGVVFSLHGYKVKWVGRFIWKWWLTVKTRKSKGTSEGNVG